MDDKTAEQKKGLWLIGVEASYHFWCEQDFPHHILNQFVIYTI